MGMWSFVAFRLRALLPGRRGFHNSSHVWSSSPMLGTGRLGQDMPDFIDRVILAIA